MVLGPAPCPPGAALVPPGPVLVPASALRVPVTVLGSGARGSFWRSHADSMSSADRIRSVAGDFIAGLVSNSHPVSRARQTFHGLTLTPSFESRVATATFGGGGACFSM